MCIRDSPHSVVYGGTHDNETLVGYFNESRRDWWELQYIVDYMGVSHKEEVVDRILFTAYASVASVVIFQVQDVLKLGNWARMNTDVYKRQYYPYGHHLINGYAYNKRRQN